MWSNSSCHRIVNDRLLHQSVAIDRWLMCEDRGEQAWWILSSARFAADDSVNILRIFSVNMASKVRFQGCALQSGGRMVVSSSMLVMGDGFLWRRVRLVVADGQRPGGNELRVPFFKKGSKTSPKLMLWSPIMCSTPTVFTAKFWISKERSDPFDEFSSTTNITRGWRLYLMSFWIWVEPTYNTYRRVNSNFLCDACHIHWLACIDWLQCHDWKKACLYTIFLRLHACTHLLALLLSPLFVPHIEGWTSPHSFLPAPCHWSSTSIVFSNRWISKKERKYAGVTRQNQTIGCYYCSISETKTRCIQGLVVDEEAMAWWIQCFRSVVDVRIGCC